jgi:uncharacterized protein YndB with AHSA1/START domain
MPEPSGSSGAHGLEITRVFDAPPERLWREWTEPERFADWFGGREAEVPISSVSMDVRPGGRWQATMHHDGVESRWQGVYREVVEPVRLVLTFSDQPGEEAHEVVTVVFTDLGDGRTEMRFEQRGTLSRHMYERTLEGWSSFLDRLDDRLQKACAPARMPHPAALATVAL